MFYDNFIKNTRIKEQEKAWVIGNATTCLGCKKTKKYEVFPTQDEKINILINLSMSKTDKI